jgi:hypothetical protein
MTRSFTLGTTPEALIKRLARKQCPDGYPMTLRSEREWRCLAAAWNRGIDSHLSALTERSSADETTGEVMVHPDELHVLLRRLFEADGLDSEADLDESWSLRTSILSTLGVEEV